MSTTALALILKPLVFLAVFLLICLPARFAVKRFVPEGRIKRILLWEISPDRY